MNQTIITRLLSIGLCVALLGCVSPVSGPVAPLDNPQDSTQQAPSMHSSQPQANQGQVLPISAKTEIAGQVIQLEVAQTPQQQQMGLMHRPALPDDRGMLFPFNPPRPVRFWMRDTPQPLDMVFLLDGEVKAIETNVPPCTTFSCPTYGPGTDINQVIELRAGRAVELGLQVGDRLDIQYLESGN